MPAKKLPPAPPELTDKQRTALRFMREAGITHVPSGDHPEDTLGCFQRDGIYYVIYYVEAGHSRQYPMGRCTLDECRRLRNVLRDLFPDPKGMKVIHKARKILAEPEYLDGVEVDVKVRSLYRSKKFNSLNSTAAIHKALDWRRQQAQDIVDKSEAGRKRRD